MVYSEHTPVELKAGKWPMETTSLVSQKFASPKISKKYIYDDLPVQSLKKSAFL